MYDTSDFRKGLKIEIDGDPYVIVDFQHVKPGKGNQFTRTRIKNMTNGRVLERTWRSGEKVNKPDLEQVQGQFLYAEGTTLHFMNTETYEQIPIEEDVLGETRFFLKEESKVQILLHNGKPVTIDPPTFVELRVTQADPGVKGDTASGAQKPVILETGYKLNVPLFINEGDVLKIDTRDGSYADRVNR